MMIKKEEIQMARLLRVKTGKTLRTCLFCARYSRGNFDKAFELCSSGDTDEGGRRIG